MKRSHRLLFAGFLVMGCGPVLLKDTNFNLWCGNNLCNWHTDQGQVRRVATWDADDYGVELVGEPVVLSQDVDLGAVTGKCLRFTVVGNVDANAQVSLDLDFSNNGTIDYTEIVPGVKWQRLQLLVKLPTIFYSSIKVLLHKEGTGAAVFAELAADSVDTCSGDPVSLVNTLGDACRQNSDCQSGVCNIDEGLAASSGWGVGTCGGCVSDADCSNGSICGAFIDSGNASKSYLACIAPQAAAKGAPCASEAQCQVGFCARPRSGGFSVCGDCAADSDCSNGSICGVTDDPDGGVEFRNCVAPGHANSGDACAEDGECAQGTCCIVTGVCHDPNTGCLDL